MVKMISLFLACVLILSFTACDTLPAETTGGSKFATENQVPPVNAFTLSNAYPRDNYITETPTGLLYFVGKQLYYYNKLTEENDLFCFDPVCDHGGYPNCISYKFFSMRVSTQTIEYCDYDRRFYALRGEQIYSFSFDGSDLRHVASFGEVGKFENDDSARGSYKAEGLMYLSIQGKYLYFLSRDSETGNRVMYRYDVETDKTEQLFSELDAIYCFHVGEKGIYMSLVGENAGFYRANLDGTCLTRVRDYFESNCCHDIFDGERMFFVKSVSESSGRVDIIVAYDPETDTYEELYKITDGVRHIPVAVTDDYVYLVRGVYTGRDSVPRQLLRIDRESGEMITVLDDAAYDAEGVYFFTDKILLYSTFQNTLQYFLCDIDEHGNFINMTSFPEDQTEIR